MRLRCGGRKLRKCGYGMKWSDEVRNEDVLRVQGRGQGPSLQGTGQ